MVLQVTGGQRQRAQLQRTLRTVRNDVNSGYAAAPVEDSGHLRQAVPRCVQHMHFRARIYAVQQRLVVGDVAFDEDDLVARAGDGSDRIGPDGDIGACLRQRIDRRQRRAVEHDARFQRMHAAARTQAGFAGRCFQMTGKVLGAIHGAAPFVICIQTQLLR